MEWERLSAPGDKCGAYWRHESGWSVRHCGHPTANYPYYGIPPRDGEEMLLAPNGRGFRLLKDALRAVEERAMEEAAEAHANAPPRPVYAMDGILVGHIVIGGAR